MSSRRDLARRLGVVDGFRSPSPALEQYRTPPEIAAHLVHEADLHGAIEGHTVVDLGTGTGMLALGAALRGPDRVVGIELDRDALSIARENERRVGTTASVHWVRGDARAPPLRTDPDDTTVLMNPPFGARFGNEGADRDFLEVARRLASVSYSLHNAGSESFVRAYADDHGASVTHAYEVAFDVPRQFEHHTEASATLETELFRIEWE